MNLNVFVCVCACVRLVGVESWEAVGVVAGKNARRPVRRGEVAGAGRRDCDVEGAGRRNRETARAGCWSGSEGP
jgi:hypothetical protein